MSKLSISKLHAELTYTYVRVLFHSPATSVLSTTGVQGKLELQRYQEEYLETVHCSEKNSNISNWLPELSFPPHVS